MTFYLLCFLFSEGNLISFFLSLYYYTPAGERRKDEKEREKKDVFLQAASEQIANIEVNNNLSTCLLTC